MNIEWLDPLEVKALRPEDINNTSQMSMWSHYLNICGGAVITKIQVNCKALCSLWLLCCSLFSQWKDTKCRVTISRSFEKYFHTTRSPCAEHGEKHRAVLHGICETPRPVSGTGMAQRSEETQKAECWESTALVLSRQVTFLLDLCYHSQWLYLCETWR